MLTVRLAIEKLISRLKSFIFILKFFFINTPAHVVNDVLILEK